MTKLFQTMLVISTIAITNQAAHAETVTYGPELEGFNYPYPLHKFSFQSQQQPLKMGYMDVLPKGKANGETVVLMHGKNFCAATWEDTINVLTHRGYRVIAPDQIGFCTATKPETYQYSFQQLAQNTHDLLISLDIQQVKIVAHSTGGMVATRYALMFPKEVTQLVMVNPIGLEDWKAKGVPWRSVDQWFERELKISAESIKNYELNTYYLGQWKPEYDQWVDMLAGLNNGAGKRLVAWNSALIYDMIFTQPVYYEFNKLQVPTDLIIGTADTTAIGSDIAPPEVKKELGNYQLLGKEITKMIPNARLTELPNIGHSPQIQDPALFHKLLIRLLNNQPKPL